jgi:hypothetical protein
MAALPGLLHQTRAFLDTEDEMELHTAEEILEELLPPLEALETQSGAVLQFLKEKGIATDEQLAPFLEQARNASNVRWRAARLRINHLLAPAFETAEKSREIKSAESAPKPESKAEVEPQEETATSNRAVGPGKQGGGKQEEGKHPARSAAPQETSAQSDRETRRRPWITSFGLWQRGTHGDTDPHR